MKMEDDIVMMDWALSFTRRNPKIALAICVGRSFASTAFPVLVEDINGPAIEARQRLQDWYVYNAFSDIVFIPMLQLILILPS